MPAVRARETIDLAALRDKLAGREGRAYWRSLEELAETEEFKSYLEAEFPTQAPLSIDPVGRRQFLKLMGASFALAGLSACTRQPTEKIFPYVKQPEEIVPGQPLYFATAMPMGGAAIGLLVESHLGRPTKVEGNPDHPASLGATNVFAQASVLSLYDPDRSQVVRNVGDIRPWSAFEEAAQTVMAAQRERHGAGFRILTESVTSPTLADQLERLLKDLPEARWHHYDPVGRDNARSFMLSAFGESFDTHYRLDQADVIVSLDADIFGGPTGVRYARDFSRRRRVEASQREMSRLYAVEVSPSNTGTRADHHLPLRPEEVLELALGLAAALGLGTRAALGMERHARWIEAVARDLERHRGSCAVIAGDWQPAEVHALAHAINDRLGNVGRTVVYTEPVAARPAEPASLADLAEDMEAGKVEVLLLLGGNPVYDAPSDLRFAERLRKVGLRIRLGLYDDETSELCHWQLPAAHFLESWSDARAYDGTASIIQPLIAPLYDGRSAHEVLALLSTAPEKSAYDLVRAYWHAQHPGGGFEPYWRKCVHDGVIPGTALPARRPNWVKRVEDMEFQTPPSKAAKESALQIVFRPDPTVHDGRFANNGWMQELPKPTTKLTWDNTAQVAPATAQRLGLANEDVVELQRAGKTVRAPVWIVPGQAEDTVTVHLGYGRRRAGAVGNGVGFDAYPLRTTEAMWSGRGLRLRKTGERHTLACTQHHHSMEGREPVRSGTLEEYRKNPHFLATENPDISLYAEHPYTGYAWGMTIDLSTCIGCGACEVACQAENNIAVVGKDEVARGREMHWIRIDRYYAGDLDNPTTHYQPVPCMQCENAPCEVVCPVGATVHDSEGLNDMVYNRCVGTRYCSNNCPYKVRRFNFHLYSDWTTETFKMQRNPDVTVRSRGVMEKCTYCVQRINYGRIQAQLQDRKIRDGEVVTACQQACPAEAIVFGDVNDPDSRVSKLKAEPRNYALLGDLNTRPRTTYLAELRNPNPEITSL